GAINVGKGHLGVAAAHLAELARRGLRRGAQLGVEAELAKDRLVLQIEEHVGGCSRASKQERVEAVEGKNAQAGQFAGEDAGKLEGSQRPAFRGGGGEP